MINTLVQRTTDLEKFDLQMIWREEYVGLESGILMLKAIETMFVLETMKHLETYNIFIGYVKGFIQKGSK